VSSIFKQTNHKQICSTNLTITWTTNDLEWVLFNWLSAWKPRCRPDEVEIILQTASPTKGVCSLCDFGPLSSALRRWSCYFHLVKRFANCHISICTIYSFTGHYSELVRQTGSYARFCGQNQAKTLFHILETRLVLNAGNVTIFSTFCDHADIKHISSLHVYPEQCTRLYPHYIFPASQTHSFYSACLRNPQIHALTGSDH
jgi:hypothetical protein